MRRDYGGHNGFDDKGRISAIPVRELFLLPITKEAADRFIQRIKDFCQLQAIDRLPFYYSMRRKINVFQEPDIHSDPPINLDGSIIPAGSREFIKSQPFLVTADAKKIDDPAIMRAPGLKRVTANCATMLGFLAEQAGIDIQNFYGDVSNIRGARDSQKFIEEIFNKASQRGKIGQCDLRICRSNSGKEGLAIRGPLPQELPLKDMVQILAGHFGSVAQFQKYFDALEPAVCDPQPCPDYLQREIDKISAAPVSAPG